MPVKVTVVVGVEDGAGVGGGVTMAMSHCLRASRHMWVMMALTVAWCSGCAKWLTPLMVHPAVKGSTTWWTKSATLSTISARVAVRSKPFAVSQVVDEGRACPRLAGQVRKDAAVAGVEAVAMRGGERRVAADTCECKPSVLTRRKPFCCADPGTIHTQSFQNLLNN